MPFEIFFSLRFSQDLFTDTNLGLSDKHSKWLAFSLRISTNMCTFKANRKTNSDIQKSKLHIL